MKRHPRYANLTTVIGVVMIAAGAVAREKAWLTRDTTSLMVSLGSYAIARRRTEAQKLDYLARIAHGLAVPAMPIGVTRREP